MDEGIASTEEVAAVLAAMSDADLVRLEQFARLRAAGMRWLDWRDLLHDAIDRVLDGTRRWPSRLPFIVFMRETIRSIAHEAWRSRAEGPITTEADLPISCDADEPVLLQRVAADVPDPEREIIARQMLGKIEALFANDPNVSAILSGMADGRAPEEIQEQAGMSPTQYASAQKRIRRGLTRAFSEGREL